ncbi:CHASE3 domain-containing protein [Paenibacillus pasadenensis]|uniref:CHASE3 domain-containing protein n=1 Tax=Paenibacillus pasadenensis TaxID=217090 RepID=UPI00203C4E1A|nr:CHASE3 domain-containing protein [Paenibacillus pasadenensis]MCM3748398.1 CHASE3 domain-containing protein [Paenibacillus pasadenensis]
MAPVPALKSNRRVTIRSKIIAGYAVILACLAVSILIVFSQLSAVQKETERVTKHDISVQRLTFTIEKNMLDMETGQRGYIITGDDQYLEPFRAGFSAWQSNFSQLTGMMEDNPTQTKALELVQHSIKEWLDITMPIIEAKQSGDEAKIAAYYDIDRGKQNMDQLRGMFDAFREREQEQAMQRLEQLERNNSLLRTSLIGLFLFSLTLSGLFAWGISRSVVRTLTSVTDSIAGMTEAEVLGQEQLSRRIAVTSRDEIADLALATNRLLDDFEGRNWLQQRALQLGGRMQQTSTGEETGEVFVTAMADALQSPYAVVYTLDSIKSGRRYRLAASLSEDPEFKSTLPSAFEYNEGLVGRCAAEQQLRHYDMPQDYVRVSSGLGSARPQHLLLVPVVYEQRTLAVIELARFFPYTELEQRLAGQAAEQLGLALHRVQTAQEIKSLLQESQSMTEELQMQAEELQSQQEELSASNEQLNRQFQLSEEKSLRLEQIQQELTLYAAELERSSRYKNEFMANMSHELRTPLNSMLILSQMLSENPERNLSSKEEEFAKVIHSAGTDLLSLINDILDLSKIEAGKMEISLEPVNLSELPHVVESLFHGQAERTGLAFSVLRRMEVPDLLVTDEQRLMQIIRNLLSNAFKFTRQGEVSLVITQADRETVRKVLPERVGMPVIAFEIRDTGIGIDPSKHELIFEAFRQADGTTSRQFGGTGLGLSISRELAALLQGSLTVESSPGAGSKFTLYLPSLHKEAGSKYNELVVPAVPKIPNAESILKEELSAEGAMLRQLEDRSRFYPAAASDSTLALDNSYSGRRVLVVDDDIRNVYSLTSFLEKNGMEVISASNGSEALDILDHIPCDLVLMDMMMPVMDGYEAIRKIRSHPEHRELPVIAITAKAMPQDRELCLEAGASDYISKPLNLEQLTSLLEVWMLRKRV